VEPEPLIRPEPTEEERRVILAALTEAEPRRPAAYGSRWRAAALEEGVSAGEKVAASESVSVRRRRPT
jgi:hypothetical protein